MSTGRPLAQLLAQLADGHAAAQRSLDARWLADLDGLAQLLAAHPDARPFAAELTPARMVATQTQLEVGVAAHMKDARTLSVSVLSAGISRRFTAASSPSQRVTATVVAASLSPPTTKPE